MTNPTDLIELARPPTTKSLITVNESPPTIDPLLDMEFRKAFDAWAYKSPSPDTRSNYKRDVFQFLEHHGYPTYDAGKLRVAKPEHVAMWRDHLLAQDLTNSSVRRKMSALRSLFSYLQLRGLIQLNPAHPDLVDTPAAPRDGKTVGLTPQDCRRFLEAPQFTITKRQKNRADQQISQPVAYRNRAIFAVLAYTGCRVGELTRLKVGSYKSDGVHRVLEIHGKGGKERRVPLHLEAVERMEAWLDATGIRDQFNGPLFRPTATARCAGRTGFAQRPMSRRAVQKLVESYVALLKLDTNVTVHSLRVTALTTAREQGSDIIDLQDFAGHADPRTTLTYIRNRDRLSKSPAYVLKY